MLFYIGGLIISFVLLIILIIDIYYGYRVYNQNTISNGEATFMIIANVLGILVVFSMIIMFFFQLFTRGKGFNSVVSGAGMPNMMGDKKHDHNHNNQSVQHHNQHVVPCATQTCTSPCFKEACGNGCGSTTKSYYAPPNCV